MSKIDVHTVEPQCGTTLTLGESGDTVTLGAGASQSGFGRTGTVDWQTGSIKTTTFTAANGEGYFANTSGGAFTMNLPAGSAGAIVSVVDYTNTFQTNALTITPNGSEKIGGIASDFAAEIEGQSLTFVYVDGTEGWKNVQDSTSNAIGNAFIVATVSGAGNTLVTAPDCANAKIATFTGPGDFTVSQVHPCTANNVVSYMVVGGGGAGGSSGGAGGGAGGFREGKSPVTPYTASPLNAPAGLTIASAAAFPVVVGGGGSGAPAVGGSGSNSSFSTITSTGGGGGGSRSGGAPPSPSVRDGLPGGSGGGGGGTCGPTPNPAGGTGNTPPVSPPQGQNGGQGLNSGNHQGGGGGGAGAVGASAGPGGSCNPGGPGGNGVATSISAASVTRGGGGGGGNQGPVVGTGGTGGGGAGGNPSGGQTAGTANTGGGGGGEGFTPTTGANGGSGIVIIRYKFR